MSMPALELHVLTAYIMHTHSKLQIRLFFIEAFDILFSNIFIDIGDLSCSCKNFAYCLLNITFKSYIIIGALM